MDYREEQKVNNPFVKGLVFIGFATAFTGIIFMVNDMVKQGQNVYEAIVIPLFTLLAFVLTYFLVFQSKLETDVSREGFGYRYFPILPKRKVIDFNNVMSWQIQKAKLFSELSGFGYRKAVFSRKSGYIMHRNEQVEFILKDGRGKVFSIDNIEMMQSALRKYVGDKEIA